MKKLFWSLAFALVWVVCQPTTVYAQGGGTVINAASCSESDVITALGMMTPPGTYTVQIPSTPCTWSTQSSFTMPANTNVFLKGGTVCTGGCAAGSAGVGLAFTDNTNITIQNTFTLTGCSATSFCDVSGITFIDGADLSNGEFQIGGTFPQICFRYHHVHWINTTRTGQGVRNKIYSGYGLVDHYLGNSSTTGGTPLDFTIYGDGPSLGYANWAAASTWGTNQAVIIEDSSTTVAHSGDEGFMDDYQGCRVVLRYSIINGETPGGVHGTDSSSNRGCLTSEIYNNSISNNNAGTFQLYNIRSGTLLFHDNVVTGSTPYGSLGLTYFRISEPGKIEQGSWGAANAGLNWTPIAVTPGSTCFGQDCAVINTLNASDWQSSHSYNFGDVIAPTSNNAQSENFQQIATGTCTSGSSRPTFPVLPSTGNATVTDGAEALHVLGIT